MTTSHKLLEAIQNCASCTLYIAGCKVDKHYGLNVDDCPVVANRLINIIEKIIEEHGLPEEIDGCRVPCAVSVYDLRGLRTRVLRRCQWWQVQHRSKLAHSMSLYWSTWPHTHAHSWRVHMLHQWAPCHPLHSRC